MHYPSNNYMQRNYKNGIFPSSVESRADNNDPGTWQTTRGSQLTQIDQHTPNTEQNLPKSSAQEIMSDKVK
jgi:hypothetical protein